MLTVSAIVLLAVSLTAQAKPDLSGRWTTEPAVAEAPASGAQVRGAQRGGGQRGRPRRGDMGSGWGPNITLQQDANRLTVEYAFFTRGDMQPPLKFTYALDGTPTKNTVMMGRGIQEQTATAAWQGDKLVITTTHPFSDLGTGQPVSVEVTQTLSLESPSELVVETTRSGILGGEPSTTRTVYRKR